MYGRYTSMHIQSVLHSDKLCASLTGLRVAEFNDLVPQFENNYREYWINLRNNRERKIGGGKKRETTNSRGKTLCSTDVFKSISNSPTPTPTP